MSQYFGNLTERMNHFREELLEAKPHVCAERAILTTEAYKEHANKPIHLKRALHVRKVLNKYVNFHWRSNCNSW